MTETIKIKHWKCNTCGIGYGGCSITTIKDKDLPKCNYHVPKWMERFK